MAAVPTIRPISELKNTNSISSLCHETKAPVFITKDGYGDLVIMSMDTYKREMALAEIYSKLDEAEAQLESGSPTKSHKEVVAGLRERVNAKT